MRICLLTDAPGHPLLAATTALLRPRHDVRWLDPNTGTAPDSPADVYLLKAHTPRALDLAHVLERRGARVVNSAAATELCQDRTRMAETAARAGLPFPRTWTLPCLSALSGISGMSAPGVDVPVGFPFMVKSRHNRRRDLVARVDDTAALRALAERWPGEEVVVQEFAPNHGWDHKLWVIAGRIFAGLRRTPLEAVDGPPRARAETLPLAVGDLPTGWPALARRVGETFGLDVYGVDVIDRAGEPLIIDINAFPGVRGQAGAPEALAALALARH